MARVPEVGETFGRYRIEERIGAGGMGVVFRATDTQLNRLVALKMVLAHHAESAEFLARFEREAEIMAKVDSPHIVTLYDHGTTDGTPWIATQFVDGGDLATLLHEQGALPPADAARVCGQVAEALAVAHDAGVIHRDVKPQNVLVRRVGSGRLHAYLGDFGIAQPSSESHFTRTGGITGSWGYLAPERAAGQEATPASDVYAVGCLLWACLSAQQPFRGTDLEVAQGHAKGPIPRLKDPSPLGRGIDALLQAAMAKDPRKRPSMADLRDRLHETAALPAVVPAVPKTVLRGAPPLAAAVRTGGRKRLLASVGAAVVALAVVLAVVLSQHGSSPSRPAARQRTAADVAPSTPSATPSATTTPSSAPTTATPVASTVPAGSLVLDADAAQQYCADAGGDSVSSTDLLSGGRALLDCGSTSEVTETFTLVDLRTSTAVWTAAVTTGDAGDGGVEVGSDHLIVLDATTVPASGLADSYTRYTVSAYRLTDGTKAWTRRLEPWIDPAARNQDSGTFGATEETASTPASKALLVHLVDTSAFDAATGTPLWHTDDDTYATSVSGDYPLVHGTLVVKDATINADGVTADVAGVDPRTSRVLWHLDYPDGLSGDANGWDTYGTTAITTGLSGFCAFDLTSGKVIAHAALPSSWANVLVQPGYVVASTGKDLALYRWTDLAHPVWKVPASPDVAALAGSTKHLLVSAPSGETIVSTATGATVTAVESGVSDLGTEFRGVGEMAQAESGIVALDGS